MIKYVVTALSSDHPLYGDFSYDLKKVVNGGYYGEGRLCRDLEEVMEYLFREEQKRENGGLHLQKEGL